MADLNGVVLGGAIGLAGTVTTLAVTIYLKFWEAFREARALRGALRAEIIAIIE